jgi:membrane dipeptidase
MKYLTRKDFLTLAGLSAAGLALRPSRLFGAESDDDFMRIHKDLIVIDGAVPLIPSSMNPEHLSWFIKGGATAISATVGGANLEAPLTTTLMSWIAEQIQTRPELMLVRSADDILTAKREGKLGIFYHFQGPSPLAYDLDRVWYYKQAGVGVLQLAYNTRNPYANGITERVDGGLSLLGIKLVEACNKARMIVDVSHTAEKSALDAIEASSEPVILSHGNALGQLNNPRNVPDNVLKAIAENGGFAGVVAYPAFVSSQKKPAMDDLLAMVDYMVNLMGVDHVSFGLDYDQTTHGAMSPEKVKAQYDAMVASGAWDPSAYPAPPYHYPEGIELPTTLHNLTGALLKRGYSTEDVAKLWGGNWMRVMKQVWGDKEAELIHDDDEPFHVH